MAFELQLRKIALSHCNFVSHNISLLKTRLKVNSVLDREPKNYSNISSFPILSNFAEIVQFFHVFIILITYLTESKNAICIKPIYLYLRQKDNYFGRGGLTFNSMEYLL